MAPAAARSWPGRGRRPPRASSTAFRGWPSWPLRGLARALHQAVDLARGQVAERLPQALGPKHLDRLDLRGLAEAEVEPQIVLRDVAGARVDLGDLRHAARGEADRGADAEAVFLAGEAEDH